MGESASELRSGLGAGRDGGEPFEPEDVLTDVDDVDDRDDLGCGEPLQAGRLGGEEPVRGT